jgi:hypothetical protein
MTKLKQIALIVTKQSKMINVTLSVKESSCKKNPATSAGLERRKTKRLSALGIEYGRPCKLLIVRLSNEAICRS